MPQVHRTGGATPMFRQGARSETAACRGPCQTALGKAGVHRHLHTILHDTAEQVRQASMLLKTNSFKYKLFSHFSLSTENVSY